MAYRNSANLASYNHAGIELTSEDGIHALYVFTSEKRFDFVISSSHIIHLAGLLELSAVVRTKCIFEMSEQLISTSQKKFSFFSDTIKMAA